MPKTRAIKLSKPVATLRRNILRADMLVYLFATKTPRKYKLGRSRIVYIGVTTIRFERLLGSMKQGERARKILKLHGVKEFDAFTVTFSSQDKKLFAKLERAFLIKFRELYGESPFANKTGDRMRWRDERDYFSTDKIEKIIKKFAPRQS